MTHLVEVVMKLTGPVNPIGETTADNERFINLQELTRLVDDLLTNIKQVANDNKNRIEHSRKSAGQFADNFINKLFNELKIGYEQRS